MPQKKRKTQKAGRPPQIGNALPDLKKLGIFRVSDAERLHVSRASLNRLAQVGQIVRLAPGLYAHPDHRIKAEEVELAIACSKLGPKSVIGGLTALFHYGLIEQVPQRIWVMVPYHVKTSIPLYRCIRTQTPASEGIDDRGTFRITNLERTLVEALRYASKIGLRTALHAARTALAEKQTTLPKIYQQAKALGLGKVIEKHWEALTPESWAA